MMVHVQPVSPIPHLPTHGAARVRTLPGARGEFQQQLERAAARRARGPQRPGGAAVEDPRAGRGADPARAPVRIRPLRLDRDGIVVPGRPAPDADRATMVRPPDPELARDPEKAALVARIHMIARHLGVDPALGEGIARAESNLDARARSPDGASVGAFQMKRPTIEEMRRRLAEEKVRLPLGDEVTLGIGYLRYLDRIFAERTVLDDAGNTTTPIAHDASRRHFVIAAYNAGEGGVAAAQREALARGGDPRRFQDVRRFLPPVTQRYVGRVLEFAAAAED
jgi:soluble lytic murein transglycosylase-like protein